MKIQVLMENTTRREDMLTEHGLSLYIETQGRRLLFDTGQSANFAQNAQTMGVDLAGVDLVVLSHGHYDHGGGLARFLELNDHAPIYLNRHAFEDHWHGEKRYIGIDQALQASDRLVYTDDRLTLAPGLELYSCNGRPLPYGLDSAGLTVRREGRLVPEDFCHEQYLLVTEGDKRVLFSGCSHKGILNIQSWFEPDVLIGGFHFAKLDPAGAGRTRLEEAARILQGWPTRYWTCHCTGVPQYEFLKQRMGKQLGYLSTGDTLEL